MSPLLIASLAHATPVVHSSTTSAAEATARAQTAGLTEVVATTFDALRRSDPVLRSGGPIDWCRATEPTSMGADPLAEARSQLLYFELEAAAATLGSLRRAALCDVATPVQASLLGQIELLDGIREELAGAPESAVEHFRRALAYDPEVPWDDAFSPQQRQRFDEVRASEAPGTIAVGVYPGLEVSIDGRPASDRLLPGEHVVEVGGRRVRIAVESGVPDALIVPSAYPDDALGWMRDEALRTELTALLGASLGEGVRAAIVVDDGVWVGTTGRVDWRMEVTPADDPDGEPRSRAVPKLVGALGTVALVAGGVVTAVGAGTGGSGARLVEEGLDEADQTKIDDGVAQRARGVRIRNAGLVLMGAGGVVGGIGVTWTLGSD